MDFLPVNRRFWDARVPVHVGSSFYDVAGFLEGKSSLTEIELPLLGDLRGKNLLHLQCHFGMDTLSLVRLGARATGIDFSAPAIEEARNLAAKAGLRARFIEANVYDAASKILEPADVLFTSYGVLGWLPDLERWAKVAAACLKPRGTLVLAEFHPVVWMYDDDFRLPAYGYFKGEAIQEVSEGSYADKSAPLKLPSISWNYSLSELMMALLGAGFRITHFQEYDFSPFPIFNQNQQVAERRWQVASLEGKLPLCFSIKAELDEA